MLNVILPNLKYLLNTILKRSLGILKVFWHQDFFANKSMHCGGATPHTCTKGVSLPFVGRVAGWQVSLVLMMYEKTAISMYVLIYVKCGLHTMAVKKWLVIKHRLINLTMTIYIEGVPPPLHWMCKDALWHHNNRLGLKRWVPKWEDYSESMKMWNCR